MPKLIAVVLVLISSLSAMCESQSVYQVGTITDVAIHEPMDDKSTRTSYDVSLKVDNTLYLVRYTPRFGLTTARYSAGRQLMVSVGSESITFRDILGEPVEVPILTQQPIEAVTNTPTSSEALVKGRKRVKDDK